MRIQRQDAMMRQLYLLKFLSLVHQPAEEGQTTLAHALRMPLHTQNRLEFRTLDGLNHTIAGLSYHAKMRTSLAHSLMMERVNI